MNQERLLQVLIEPRVSEKATRLADSARQFVFRVIPNATKPEIKQAVEVMFS
ncbi:MAG: 50S ribosomal protein L23, partial [Gammaproteobacteria bacterium]